MIAFETLVYLNVYKTGSSHVIALLRQVMDERQMAFTRHRDLVARRDRLFLDHFGYRF